MGTHRSGKHQRSPDSGWAFVGGFSVYVWHGLKVSDGRDRLSLAEEPKSLNRCGYQILAGFNRVAETVVDGIES